MDLAASAPLVLRDFFHRLPAGLHTRIHVLTDSDADGLPAAALLVRALRFAGYTHVTAAPRKKAENAWVSARVPATSPGLLDRVRQHAPEALCVLDMGSRSEPIHPGIPTLLIDHHAWSGVPADAQLITGYGAEPTPTTGLLAWWSIRDLLPEPLRHDWLWLAAISLLSDLGDRAPFPELAAARARWSAKSLRDATTLLNAPRRTALGDASAALALLLKAESSEQVTSGEFPETSELLEAKAEVAAALATAKKNPPRFSRKFRDTLGADLVAIRMSSPCQVHPLVVQLWRARFPKSIIFGVNTGYRPGWVHFSARAPRGVDLLGFLRQHAPPGADPSYGVGHDQASGGALLTAAWNLFAQDLGFGPDLHVYEEAA